MTSVERSQHPARRAESGTAPRSSLARVLDALREAGCTVRERGDHADAQCPAHDDRTPSLSVDWKTNTGKALTVLYCHAGCAAEDVLDALGLRLADTYDDPPKRPDTPRSTSKKRAHTRQPHTPAKKSARKPLGAIEAEYIYAEADGTIVGWLTRHEGKQFRWSKPNAYGRRVAGAPSSKPLYLLPLVQQAIRDEREIHLCEGEKDADALVDAGVCATTVPGGATVTKAGSAKGNLTDAHVEALRGAHVVIWADRDGPDPKNPARGHLGYRHALHVRDRLDDVATSVRVVHATAGKDAADHLAAGHSIADAEVIDPAELIADTLDAEEPTPDNVRYLPTGDKGGGGGGGDETPDKREIYLKDHFELYEHPEDGPVLVKVKEYSDRIERTRIINADVRIVRHVIRDIGEESEAEPMVDLEVFQHGQTHTLTSVPRKEFEDPVKWAGKIPLPLIFNRGQGKGQVINAITQASGIVPVDTAYGLLGWREVHPGEWAYIHAGGAIGSDGPLLGTRVEVSPRLREFTLPADIPTGNDLRASYDAVMAIADTLPHHIAYPLIAAGCRAVLGDNSTPLYLWGSPGSLKTGTAALIQQMYCPEARFNHMPAGAGEDAAAGGGLEQIMHEAGHTFLVLDDIAPDRGAQRASARASAILRAAGNRQSKLRLERETSKGLRTDKPPRAMVVVTGEDQPTVKSSERRTIYIPFRKGEINIDDLRELSTPELIAARPGLTAALAQRAAAKMPTKAWLEAQRDYWARWLQQPYGEATDGTLAGYCNNIAELATGIHTMLDMVVEAGVVPRDEAAQRWHEAWQALRGSLSTQLELADGRGLSERFGELIRSALVSHNAHLQDTQGGQPINAEQFGWTSESGGSKHFGARPNGKAIGWTDGTTIWLQPGAAFAVAVAEGSAQSDPLGITQRAMKDALVGAYPDQFDPPPKGKTQPREPRKTVGGVRQRVWQLPLDWLYPSDDTTNDDDPPPHDVPPSPDSTPTPPEPKDITTPVESEKPKEDTTESKASEKKPARTQQPTHSQARSRSSQAAESTPRYRAAGIVLGADTVYPINGTESIEHPKITTISELMDWAVTLGLGVAHDGKRRTKDGGKTGARDDAGLIVLMPDMAKRLGAPTKPPRRDKPIARNHKLVKALTEAGWTLGERGLQPYTQIWRADDASKTGRAHFLVFPHWSTEPIFADLPRDPAELAYRLSLYVGTLGHQLVYTAGSTGAGMVRQLRATTGKPLTTNITDVPPPGQDKDQAPLEDLEWDYWRALTEAEQNDCTHIVGVDINASYLAAAQSAILGYGAPTQHTQPTIGSVRDLKRQPGYWLIDPTDAPMPHLRMPDLLDPHGTGRPTRPTWITTARLLPLVEAGIPVTAREAWIYPDPGTHLQVWARVLRDALYELKAYAHDADDIHAEAVLTEIKLTYAAGLGQLASQRWRKETPLWLPHWNQAVKGLAQANIWRKVKATGEATGRYPVGIARDTVYYPTTSSNLDSLPLNVPSGFVYDGDGRYVIGHTKWSGTARMDDYLAAQAVTDKSARINAMNTIWTTPTTPPAGGDRA